MMALPLSGSVRFLFLLLWLSASALSANVPPPPPPPSPSHMKVAQQQQQQQQQQQPPSPALDIHLQQEQHHHHHHESSAPQKQQSQQHEMSTVQGTSPESPTQRVAAVMHQLQHQQQQQQQQQQPQQQPHATYHRSLFPSHSPTVMATASSAHTTRTTTLPNSPGGGSGVGVSGPHHYVRNAKDALFHDVIASLSSDDEDFGDAYHLLNELKRHETTASGRAASSSSPTSFPFPYTWSPSEGTTGRQQHHVMSAIKSNEQQQQHQQQQHQQQHQQLSGERENPSVSDSQGGTTTSTGSTASIPLLSQRRPFEEVFMGLPTPMPRLVPFFGYAAPATPVFVPFPLFVTPEMFYGASSSPAVLPDDNDAPPSLALYSTNGNGIGGDDDDDIANSHNFFSSPASNAIFEDNYMARAATSRRPTISNGGGGGGVNGISSGSHHQHHRNSPIYYVRMPPRIPTPNTTPFMFLPGLSYATATTATANPYLTPSSPFGGASILPFQPPLPPNFHSYSAVYNLPVNFVANGKPTSIFQMAHDPTTTTQAPSFTNLANQHSAGLHFASNYGGNPFAAPHHSSSYVRPTRPIGGFSIAGPSIAPPPIQDSKLLSLKRPYYFNGRPEDIYILPNNFNPLYTDSGYY